MSCKHERTCAISFHGFTAVCVDCGAMKRPEQWVIQPDRIEHCTACGWTGRHEDLNLAEIRDWVDDIGPFRVYERSCPACGLKKELVYVPKPYKK